MAELDPLGLTPAQRAGQQVTQARVDDGAIDVVTVGIRVDEAHMTDQGRYCPARLPCLGRTGVGVAIPVRRLDTGEQVNEVHGTYCPNCRTMAADAPRRD
jgi:hypothetical protein